MKSIKKSSLFFCVIIGVFFKVGIVCAQQSVDSLQHYYKLTINPKNNRDLLSALAFFDKHKVLGVTNNDTMGVVYDLRIIAIIQNKIGALRDSEKSAVQALRLLDNFSGKGGVKKEPRLGLYNHLGKICRELMLYDRALSYYDQARNNAMTYQEFVTLDNNVANTYLQQNKFELAAKYFEKAYKGGLIIGDTATIARAQSNLGLAQLEVGKDGLSHLLDALALRKRSKNIEGVFTSYMHLSKYYKKSMNLDKAVVFNEMAKRLADSTNNVKLKEYALSSLVDLNANPIVLEYKKLHDSLSKSNQFLKDEDSFYEYELDKLKELASGYFQANEKQKKWTNFLFIIIALVIPTVVFWVFITKTKHKKQTLQEVYNTERHISKKVHDEVANDVFHLMTKLQSDCNISEKVIDDLDSIYKKTRNIAKEHCVLDYDGYFEEALNDLLLSFNTVTVNIITKDLYKINWKNVSKIKRDTIYKVLQELMINMAKHSQASIVALTFGESRKKIKINYSDNGMGTSLKKSTGLQNVENRIQSIKGTINFATEIKNGFKAKITV